MRAPRLSQRVFLALLLVLQLLSPPSLTRADVASLPEAFQFMTIFPAHVLAAPPPQAKASTSPQQATISAQEFVTPTAIHDDSLQRRLRHYEFVVHSALRFNAKLPLVDLVASHQRVLADIEETVDIKAASRNIRRRFLVRFQDQCGHRCHVPMVDAYGQHAYSILDHNSALITLSPLEMEALFAVHAHSQFSAKRVLSAGLELSDFTPLLPEVKVADKALSACHDFHSIKALVANITAMPSLTAENREKLIKQALGGVSVSVSGALLRPLVTVVTIDLESAGVSAVVDQIVNATAGFLVPHQPYQSDLVEGVTQYLVFEFDAASDDDCGALEASLGLVAQLPEVQWIEQRFRNVPSNRWVKGITQTADSKYQPLTLRPNAALTGSGQIIGVSDTGIDHSSCYFYDPNMPMPFTRSASYSNSNHRKVVQYYTYVDASDDDESHGTHVCGTITGKAYAAKAYGDFVKYNGMVTEAKLAFFDIGQTCYGSTPESSCGLKTPPDINTGLLQIQYGVGARIFSFSWGCSSTTSSGCGGAYDSQASQVDLFLWNHPDAVLFVANGNTGGSAAGTSTSVGSPATAKSCVSVGASLTEQNVFKAFANSVPDGVSSDFNINALAFFSSRGPTLDKRIKPEVTAPGWWVNSAAGLKNSSVNHCTIKTLQGTSMATPAAAGNAAIIRQYFMSGFYPSGAANVTDQFTPSGALVKAMLLHSAQPLSRVVEVAQTTGHTFVQQYPGLALPDNNQGYGRIQLDQVLFFGTASDLCSYAPNCPAETDSAHTHTFPSINVKTLTFFVWGGVGGKHSRNVTAAGLGQYFYFKTPSGTPTTLQVTLAYTDYPSDPLSGANANTPAIKNALDVQVEGPVASSAQCQTPSCQIYHSKLYSATAAVVNPHGKVVASNLAPSSTYRIYVGPSLSSTLLYPQPFALVASFAGAQAAATLGPYKAADMPASAYTMPGQPADYISSSTTSIIAVFSVIGAILGGLVGIIYFSHKQATRLEEEEIARRVGGAMQMDRHDRHHHQHQHGIELPTHGAAGR